MEKLYYAAIEVSVPMMGRYSFTGSSLNRMDGHLCGAGFDPTDPNRNVISTDVKSDSSEQLEITADLQSG